ncbi:MAG: hypothetical protein A2087_05060 [Spirochaetes bacterium GWD1_61_31]|nr:MAG: hypothetical protein A2Y37_00090 [Spirochaetes bacterium GWB1_60_80]OHD32151.1 MAG: hypothetical protein A2004_05115 [Spirochaetes bacterium GWC1_61_12]OHD42389.1 MAG: hypothetical protein A2087_05060 [Spirochaetes bacterium GWD1_61_31]OHD42670.1 MAG: hypothetical protein A2Y35_12205 [Spirochaetes bacterium GWE1_60_18]OHD58551.1 MAG: hypothetical protein A2Y32_08785 [Spirochaetes bacterium GWF1_60_12]HAP43944.1 hypothetical protein [Spirochaetaceae bacterium]
MATVKSVLVNTLLGPGSSFRGDLVIEGFIRVDGWLRGSLRSTGKVVISAMARCDASIIAASAIVGGVVRGDVCVSEQLELQDGAVIVGNVFAPKLDANANVIIHGQVLVGCGQADAVDAMQAFLRKYSGSSRPLGGDQLAPLPPNGQLDWRHSLDSGSE